jgi:TPR repeat protein
MAMRWLRKAAENGHADSCLRLAHRMYGDQPYAREVGHVGEAAGAAAPAGVMEGHDVPTGVLTGVVHWLRKGRSDIIDTLLRLPRMSAAGGAALPQRRVRGCGPSEGLQGLSAVQDRPVLRRRMSESRLDYGWAQVDVW